MAYIVEQPLGGTGEELSGVVVEQMGIGAAEYIVASRLPSANKHRFNGR